MGSGAIALEVWVMGYRVNGFGLVSLKNLKGSARIWANGFSIVRGLSSLESFGGTLPSRQKIC